MELNYILSILDRDKGEEMTDLCAELGLPLALSALGRGTAGKKILDLYGLVSSERAVIMTVANGGKTKTLLREARKRFYMDIPGNGILLSVPIKSVGGEDTLAFLSEHAVPDQAPPQVTFAHEMIVAIANEGYSENVMDAARAAGAVGGTVIHAKGTGAEKAEKFFGVLLAHEKDVILIVAKAAEKAGIMRGIVRDAGPGSPAGSIVFSLPVSHIAGLRIEETPE